MGSASWASYRAAAEGKRAAANRAAEVLATHAPKLLLRREALEYWDFTGYGGMVQRALHWLGMTPAERAAHEEQRRRRLLAQREQRAANKDTTQLSQAQ